MGCLLTSGYQIKIKYRFYIKVNGCGEKLYCNANTWDLMWNNLPYKHLSTNIS